MRVLVVDDDRFLTDSLSTLLGEQGFAVDTAYDGSAAIELLSVNGYDGVVLDRGLPDLRGDDVCAWIMENTPQVKVLMLTVADSIGEKLTGFSLGADDYLTKPFDIHELVARLRALGRRPAVAVPPVLRAAGVELDPFRRVVFRDGRPLGLTRKQFGVLELLMRADGGVVSSETLLEKVWDENADPFTNTVRVTLSTLRRKLGDPPLIHTVLGVGYRFHG